MEKPLVSVLMPMYNVASFVEEAINSILEQDFSQFELIIIDDGSLDHSLEITENLASSDERIRVYSQTNKGITYTRNRLVSLAEGCYLAWMDADDVSCARRLSSQYNYLSKHQEVLAVGSWAMLIDEKSNDICRWITPGDHVEIDRRHISGSGGAIVFPSSMMRREAVTTVGGFNESLKGAEDLDLFLRLAERGNLANLEEVLFKYRQHLNSISHESSSQILLDTSKVLELAFGRRSLDSKDLIVRGLPSQIKEHDIFKKWAWWALRDGNVDVARKFALKTIFHDPMSLSSWKALFFALRGR